MEIIIGADHGGYELKEKLKRYLMEKGHDVEDIGAHQIDMKDDYVPFALAVAKKVAAAEEKRLFQEDVKGILICRSAAGMVIAANKVKGARTVCVFDEKSAVHSREHNAANVIAISGDWTDEEKAKEIIDAWLKTPFSNEERHAKRLKMIHDYENK